MDHRRMEKQALFSSIQSILCRENCIEAKLSKDFTISMKGLPRVLVLLSELQILLFKKQKLWSGVKRDPISLGVVRGTSGCKKWFLGRVLALKGKIYNNTKKAIPVASLSKVKGWILVNNTKNTIKNLWITGLLQTLRILLLTIFGLNRIILSNKQKRWIFNFW